MTESAPPVFEPHHPQLTIEGSVVERTRPPAARPVAERHFIVGVDFGTSTTKVIWQDLSDNSFEVFSWTATKEGLDAMLLPSTVVIRDDTIYFGLRDAESIDGDIRLSSIKLCVLCRTNPAICRCGSTVAKSGCVQLPGSGIQFRASVFASLLLAYVFNEIDRGLKRRFPDDELVLIWNLGCPMDYLDQANRKQEWETIAGVAMKLRREITNPISTRVLPDIATRVQESCAPPDGNQNYFVRPEGLAAVQAFLQSPHAEQKTYAIVDVGAGTTEVSLFFKGGVTVGQGRLARPSYLADSTRPVGGVKIDLELAQEWHCTPLEARKRKEAEPHSVSTVPAIGEICRQYEDTCVEILRHRRLTAPSDKLFDLFIIGGGGRLHCLQTSLCACQMPGQFALQRLRRLEPPNNLRGRSAIQTDYDLFANACGLASSLEWEYYLPSEVEPMDQHRTQRVKRDREELYPK